MKLKNKIIISILLGWLGCIAVLPCWALTATEVEKLLANDGADGDSFGRSVSIDGDFAVIGADDNGVDFGAAYVFVRNNGVWTEQQKLIASDGEAGDKFGQSVSIDRDTIVIGAPHDDTFTGSAYVFERNAGVWTEQQKLLPSDAPSTAQFGDAVSIYGNTVLIGAPTDTVNTQGADGEDGSAYVFIRNNNVWTEQQKLTASNFQENMHFGSSVSIWNDTAVIGARPPPCIELSFCQPQSLPFPRHFAFVFVRNNGAWTEQQILSNNVGGLRDLEDQFGWSVSVDGDTTIIGAPDIPDDLDENGGTGMAYVFVRRNGVWTEQQKLLANDGAEGDSFGRSVSIDGGFAVIGALGNFRIGSAYAFVLNNRVWSEQVKLLASDGEVGDGFGRSVSASRGGTAMIGAAGDDDNGNSSGSAYVFEALEVDIDIKPGDDSNSIDLRSEVDVWVAILSNIDPDSPFDPLAQVDIPTVEFGPNKANAIGQGADDINNDGLDDLLLRFNIAESGLTIGNSNAILSGLTFAGLLFIGSDGVVVFMSSGGGGGGSFYLLPLLLLVLIAIKKLDNKLHLLKYF